MINVFILFATQLIYELVTLGEWYEQLPLLRTMCDFMSILVSKAHNRQKWKSAFLTCPCHKFIGKKQLVSNILKENYDFFENVKFGAILWKIVLFFVNNLLD